MSSRLKRWRKAATLLAAYMGLVVGSVFLTVDGSGEWCFRIGDRSGKSNHVWALCKIPQVVDSSPDPDE